MEVEKYFRGCGNLESILNGDNEPKWFFLKLTM